MMPLVPLEGGHLGAFDEIIRDKEEPRRSVLRRLRFLLSRRYRLYSNARRDLAALPRSCAYLGVRGMREAIVGSHAFPDARKRSPAPRSSFDESEQRDALLQCYNGDTTGLNEMLGRIRRIQPLNQRWSCQYCCGMSRSSTWDHYLHKSSVPRIRRLRAEPGSFVRRV